MQYVVCSIGLLAAVLSALPALPARASDTPQVLLSEINWAGSSRSNADEWFELANIGDASVDVGGWIVSGVATGGEAISLAPGTVISSHGTLLVANYDVGEQSTLTVHPDLITTALSLSNRGLTFLLVMPDGTVVDSLTDTGTPDFGDAVAFSSMERDLATSGWITATASVNLADGQLGTPGSAVFPTPEPSLSPTIEEPLPAAEEPLATTEEPIVTTEEPPVTIEEPPITEEVVAIPEEVAIEEALPVEEPILIPEEPVIDPTIEPVYAPIEEPVALPSPEITPEVIPEPEPAPLPEPEPEPAPLPTPVLTPVPTPEPEIATTGAVIINELVSDPDVGNEWVEMLNTDVVPINLDGWYITDASEKATVLNGITLMPGEYYVIENPLGKLNNEGDTVTLFTALGTPLTSIDYSNVTVAKKGESIAWDGNTWQITTLVTKGTENMFPPPADVIEETVVKETIEESYADAPDIESAIPPVVPDRAASADVAAVAPPARVTVVAAATPRTKTAAAAKPSSRSKTTSTPSFRIITSLVNAEEGERVQYTGTLIALPGTFGKQVAALDGAMLYLNKADWPALRLHDVVRVEGIVSISRGEKRIKLTADGITVTGQAVLTPLAYEDARTTSLVTVRGTVVARDGDTLMLDVNGTQLAVRASDATGITWSQLPAATFSITGVYRIIDGTPVLMPRSPDDIVIVTDSTLSSPSTTIPHAPARPWVGAGLLTSSAGALGYWFLRSRSLLTV